MNRWRMLLLCTQIALVGCQTGIETSETTQELNDCTPGGNYCNSQMPPVPPWNGQLPPPPGPKQNYMVYPRLGDWAVLLVDTGQGAVVWAASVKKQNLGTILVHLNYAGPVDGVRPPPPPPGGSGEIRYLLERALRFQQLNAEALNAAAQCGQ